MAIADVKEYTHLTDEDIENIGKELDAIRAEVIAERDPDVIEGHNIFRFDLEYIEAGSDSLPNAFAPILLDDTRLGADNIMSILSEGWDVIVDGAEGGTAAAPLEYEDHVGLPLTDGLMTMHNALVGTGLRDKIKIGASGKVAAGNDIVKRLIQGADYTNAARAMMMAVGCIQAQRCHTNKCPVGVTTQDPKRARALDVADKSLRTARFQQDTVRQAVQIMASLGAGGPDELGPHLLRKKISPTVQRSYAELYEWLTPGQLLAEPPTTWADDWAAATPDSFHPTVTP